MHGPSSLEILHRICVSDWSCWSWKLSCALWQRSILTLTHRPHLSPQAEDIPARMGLCRVPLELAGAGKGFKGALHFWCIQLELCQAAHQYFEKQKASCGHQSQKIRVRQSPSAAGANFRRILSTFLLNSSSCLLSSFSFFELHSSISYW